MRSRQRVDPRTHSVSGSTLRKLLENPVDVGYCAETKARPYLPWQKVIVMFACALLGFSTVWSVRALRAPDEAAAAVRETLTTQVTARIAELDETTATNATLAREAEELQARLTNQAPAVSESLIESAAAAGTYPVSGPGITIELDDTDVDAPEERVRDFDLQVIVNALWASQAEAVAINGERVGPLTAIRTAGQAILVNLKPLNPPYVIEAIGDPTEIQTTFARTRGASHIAGLRDIYGVQVDVTSASSLTLRAAQQTGVKYAKLTGVEDEQVGK
ncbi:MAG: DUF881 domain-containing protein [Bowdeniella nasicola]|nr:DUF881 domain-containing protein [Bowdeniella nasicola]